MMLTEPLLVVAAQSFDELGIRYLVGGSASDWLGESHPVRKGRRSTPSQGYWHTGSPIPPSRASATPRPCQAQGEAGSWDRRRGTA